MSFQSSIAVTALVLGLSAGTDVDAASATCRKLHKGAVERVCRWQLGKGDVVNIYYGAPSPPSAPAPVREETDYAPAPVSYPGTAYYDYGYALPFVVGADRAHAHARRPGSWQMPVGRTPSFHPGADAAFQSGGFRGRGGHWRR